LRKPPEGEQLLPAGEGFAGCLEYEPERVKVKRFHLARKPLAPCNGCMAHRALKGECRIKDTLQDMRNLWIDADFWFVLEKLSSQSIRKPSYPVSRDG
jgi:hypothetical protein